MTRIKFAAISAITAAMILGSTLVFAATPAGPGSDPGADSPSISTDLTGDPNPRRGGGGSGAFLK
jgi:hypothetical protein